MIDYGEFAGPKAHEAVIGLTDSLPTPLTGFDTPDLYRLQRAILQVAHLTAPAAEAAVDGQNYIARLPELDIPAYRFPAISRTVGRMVIAETIGGKKSEEIIELVPPERAAQSVELFDKAGMLLPYFWHNFGLQAVVSTKNPHFLPLLHTKLCGPQGEAILAQVDRPQVTARSFTTTVLRSYANDSQRNTANARRALRNTKPGGLAGDNVDLTLLVQEANRVTNAFNAYQQTTKESAELDDTRLVSVGDAFLRVLSMTRSPNVPPAVRGAQLEQDVAYADIVSLLLSPRHTEANLSRTELALRFPDLTPQHRRRIYELVQAGMPISEAVKLPHNSPDTSK